MRTLLSSACLLVLCAGCGLWPWSRKPAANPAPAMTTNAPMADRKFVVTPEESAGGKIIWLNPDLRFVVLSFPIGQVPAVGQHLNVYRNGLKIGEVKIAGPQQNDNIVADITSGDAQSGDEVRDR